MLSMYVKFWHTDCLATDETFCPHSLSLWKEWRIVERTLWDDQADAELSNVVGNISLSLDLAMTSHGEAFLSVCCPPKNFCCLLLKAHNQHRLLEPSTVCKRLKSFCSVTEKIQLSEVIQLPDANTLQEMALYSEHIVTIDGFQILILAPQRW